jgi:hypothetical protein
LIEQQEDKEGYLPADSMASARMSDTLITA